MTSNIAIDPTMFADSGINSTKNMINDLSSEGFQFYVSASFYDLMMDIVENEGELPYRGDQHTIDYFTSYSKIESIYETAETVVELDISRFDAQEYIGEEATRVYQNFYESLPAPDARDNYQSPYAPRGFRLSDIYFEELIFGVQMSPILSRIKRTAKDLKNGADYLVELSDEYLDEASAQIERQMSRLQSRHEVFREEWEELEDQSRNRNDQDPDDPVRRIAVLREIVKTYPDTNYINYLLKSSPPFIAATTGTAIGGPMGAVVGGSAGSAASLIGLYFADP